MKYHPTIGLEIHAELTTESKMFCGCKNAPFQSPPNTNVCPVCLGLPGALPVPNRRAIGHTIILGKALNCKIAPRAKFDRKHYFYPDLPKGYQISQYDQPFCREGYLNVNGEDIAITRIHLEEDTGKLLHLTQAGDSLIDLNRAGVPLVELVTEPVLKAGSQARDFAKSLRQILVALGISGANLERGEMRIEANVSVSDKKNLGTKVEVKNLNSFQSVQRAIDYEIHRQTKLLEKGLSVKQETRGFNQKTGETYPQRVKETAADYRYFPEPDIPPFELIEFAKDVKTLWERLSQRLPEAQVKRFAHLGLSKAWLDILLKDKKKMALARRILKLNSSKKETLGAINLLVNRPQAGELSAKKLLEISNLPGHLQKQALAGKSLQKESDIDLEGLVEEVIQNNSGAVGDFRAGKQEALKFLLGQIMAKSQGQANPARAKNLLLSHLKKGN